MRCRPSSSENKSSHLLEKLHMKRKKITYRMLFRILALTLIVVAIALGIPRLITEFYGRSRTYSTEQAPTERIAIVFGAGLMRDGTPTAVLRDRVATAADLFFSGKVDKLLFSGDNRFVYYNEPGSMKTYAMELGVPADAIVLDYAGRRTYDTCYRAKEIFGVKQALAVTQSFHLPRALFLCNAMGIETYGVSADRQRYRISSQGIWQLRELPATFVAILEAWVTKPVPVLGNPEPIFPDEARLY
jgi:SanA protein